MSRERDERAAMASPYRRADRSMNDAYTHLLSAQLDLSRSVEDGRAIDLAAVLWQVEEAMAALRDGFKAMDDVERDRDDLRAQLKSANFA